MAFLLFITIGITSLLKRRAGMADISVTNAIIPRAIRCFVSTAVSDQDCQTVGSHRQAKAQSSKIDDLLISNDVRKFNVASKKSIL